jgi:nucleoside-diphosphate-sugar epimerase
VLVRPSAGIPPEERIRKLLDWHGIDGEGRGRLRVVRGDLLDPGLGLATDLRFGPLADIEEIIHCASETSFAERKRGVVEAVNLDGLSNLLEFAASRRCGIFQLVSTAYVAGKRRGVCREELASVQEFHNAYEETKWKAERLAFGFCRDCGIRLNIFRPSVVCGDSTTGRSLVFNAVYHAVRAAVLLRDLYLKDIRMKGGRRASAAGVRIAEDGSVHLPLRIGVESGTGVDIIPVDHFVSAFMILRKESQGGGIFHIAAGRPTPVAAIVDFCRRFFRLTGVEALESGSFPADGRNPLETLFDEFVEAYRPYMNDPRIFARDRTGKILKRNGLEAPEFDFGLFSRCMGYAMKTEWGARTFSPGS